MRIFSGKILVRVPPGIHKELAREAFESGRSINQLCTEALLARRALKNYNPWKSIERLWLKNRHADVTRLTREIREAIAEVVGKSAVSRNRRH